MKEKIRVFEKDGWWHFSSTKGTFSYQTRRAAVKDAKEMGFEVLK